jgi:hypothetical protein
MMPCCSTVEASYANGKLSGALTVSCTAVPTPLLGQRDGTCSHGDTVCDRPGFGPSWPALTGIVISRMANIPITAHEYVSLARRAMDLSNLSLRSEIRMVW